jgi:tRNA threonylcarbamoyladenosine modification (KEOPS) complex  Pcc1 subunit
VAFHLEVTSMRTKATIRLKLPSRKHMNVVFRALEPEVKKTTTLRSNASLQKEDRLLVLRVEAKDTVALRAALNAYLRWINSVIRVLDILEAQWSG